MPTATNLIFPLHCKNKGYTKCQPMWAVVRPTWSQTALQPMFSGQWLTQCSSREKWENAELHNSALPRWPATNCWWCFYCQIFFIPLNFVNIYFLWNAEAWTWFWDQLRLAKMHLNLAVLFIHPPDFLDKSITRCLQFQVSIILRNTDERHPPVPGT